MLDRTSVVLDRQRADQLARDGFIHLEHVIPADRIVDILHKARNTSIDDNFHHNELFSILLEQLKVHRLVQSLHAEPVYYFGKSSVMRERKATAAHLHDDAKGSPIPADGKTDHYLKAFMRPFDPVRHPTFPIYRLLIYLNDHTKHSGGTKVKRRSYKRYELLTARGFKQLLRGRFKNIVWPFFGYVNPMVKPGDAVLFNLRARHSGHFVRLRGPLSNFAMPPYLDNAIKRLTLDYKFGLAALNLIAYPFPDARTSIVIDFCTESDWARGFQANRLFHPGNENSRPQIFDCNNQAFISRMLAIGLPVLNSPALPKVETFLKGS